MEADIKKLRHNIETASALYQTKYNDNIKLSNSDDFFLRKTQRIITMSNELGNNRLKKLTVRNPRIEGPCTN